ncbi:MAG: enoyl-CoA hydratase/isomerase family protein [Mycolicibacterium rufum]|nr:enoyl-CoA hydratase/isomerase family protein [Mycolicibacterium rufum]
MLQRYGEAARITLNRPGKRNALSTGMLRQLRDVLETVSADSDLRVVTVHGAGPVFCAGADTREFGSATAEYILGPWTVLGQRVFNAMAELPQTTIAVITGGAYGGGLELALHCDFRIAARGAVVALPEAALGTAPGWSGLSRVVEVAGLRAARMLALTGRRLGAADALRLGVVDEVADDADSAAQELVSDILATAPAAQSIIKRALTNRQPSAALVDSLAGAYLAHAAPQGRT